MPPRPLLLCLPLILATGCKGDPAPEREAEPRSEVQSPAPEPESKTPTPAKTKSPQDAPKVEPTAKSGGLAAMTRDLVDGISESKAADPLAYVPSRAVILAQVSPAKFFAVDGFARFSDAILAKGDGEVRHTIAAMEACGTKLDQIESVTFAMDENDDGALVVRGTGLGKADTWRCIKTETASRGGSSNYEIREQGGKTVLVNGEDEGRFVGDDTFVYLDTKWANEVDNLIDGTSKSTVTTSGLADTMARVKTDEALWFASLLPPKALDNLRGSPMEGIDEVWGALSIGSDSAFAFSIAGKAPSDAEATKMRDEVQKAWDDTKSMLGAFGVPQKVADSIEFKASGDVASFHMKATIDDVDILRERLMSSF